MPRGREKPPTKGRKVATAYGTSTIVTSKAHKGRNRPNSPPQQPPSPAIWQQRETLWLRYFQARFNRLEQMLRQEEVHMSEIDDAILQLSQEVDADQASTSAAIARVEALITTLESNPSNPATVAAINAQKDRLSQLRAQLDAERADPQQAAAARRASGTDKAKK